MPFPGPPPVPGPPAAPAPAPAAPLDPLDEARERLEALDELPLHDHPEQFTAVDRLLRSALDGTDRVSR